jgi:hypothetical protein
MNVSRLINYNSHFLTFMQAMLDAGQDPSRLNSHAYAKRVSVPWQEHRMPPVLRHCKISLFLLLESPCVLIRQLQHSFGIQQIHARYWWKDSVRFSNKVHSCWRLHQSTFNRRVSLCDSFNEWQDFLLLQSSATTNETTINGSDIATAFKTMFPSIQDAEINALIAVCSAIFKMNIFQI